MKSKPFKKNEIEVKILNIDVPDIEKRLESVGARKIFHEMLTRTLIFDHPQLRLRQTGRVLRLRQVGNRAYLSIKEGIEGKSHSPFQQVRESEIVIDNFMQAFKLFESLGFEAFRYQEKMRTAYTAPSGVRIEIDQYPKIPPYLEIEAPYENVVESFVKKLGFSMGDTVKLSATQILKEYGIKDVDIIRFSDTKDKERT